MLNISHNIVPNLPEKSRFRTFQYLSSLNIYLSVTKTIGLILLVCVLILFLPWTQNIQGDGLVTTLRPEQRPQTIQSVIHGRIEKWYKGEGDFVAKGDTILSIVEIVDAFFDPELINRTREQIRNREGSYAAVNDQAESLKNQIDALYKIRDIKLEQVTNKIRQAELKLNSDSIKYKAALTEIEVAKMQLTRFENLLQSGLVSLTDLEGRKIRVQEAEARFISAENQVLISKNDLLNAQAELISIRNEYADKISKANADLHNVINNKFNIGAELERMRNQLSNIEIRTTFRYVIAPQDGFIAQALVPGVGENVKEGQPLVSIMPSNYELAVAFWVRPIDLPLIKVGYPVRFIFDGWPAFVFSGWPQASFGTFGGRIAAIDNFTTDNNLYRVLVAPDPNDEEWPKELRVGSGAKGFALLGDVPMWFEIWRQLNGFPPDYYTKENEKSNVKRKEPLRQFK